VEARQMLQEEGRRTIADQSYVGALIQKWGDFLEGLADHTEQDRYILGCTAMLMENESLWLQSLSEETRTVNVGSFTKFIFPVLRRVFPNLIANEIVSVQPMTAPIGAVFFLDYIYGSSKGATTEGDVFPRDFDRDYSSEFVNGEPMVTGDGVNYGGGGTPFNGNLAWTPVRPLDTQRGFSVIIREVAAADGSTVQEATGDGSGGFTFVPTGGSVGGAINHANGAISAFSFQNIPALGNQVKAYYYFDGELNTKVPEVKLDVKKAPVEAIPRRLKALWSSEAAEDLRAFHGLDAETEIVSIIAQEIALEIDREIIQDLFLASTGTTGTFDRIPPGGISEIDHLRAILTQISTVSNLIHKKTLRAPANWIVTSPEISALLTQLTTHGDFKPIWSADMNPNSPTDLMRPRTSHGQFSIYKAGTLMNKWVVYEDPFFATNKMMIGLKGGSFLESGFVWAPYVPLQVTPTFLDPSDFSFRKGLRTRYAKKLLRPDFYGQLTVNNL
jgi:Straboviridae major head protein